MTFERPALLLLLLLLPILWIWMRGTSFVSRTCLALKCAVSAILVIALAGPWGLMPVHRLAVTMVLDTSSSMSPESRRDAQALLEDLVRKNSNATVQLVTFSELAHLDAIPPRGTAIPVHPQGAESATDLEAGLQLALNTLPQEGVGRVLLVSDGNENPGRALAAARRARERSVAVYTLPMDSSTGLRVHLESAAVPQHVFSGERFLLSLRIGSARDASARLSIMCQGQEIAGAPIALRTGINPVAVEARITGSGLRVLEVHIEEGRTERLLGSQAITVNQPRVLYISSGGRPSDPLLDTLKRADVDVETREAFPTDLTTPDWDTVILDNYPDGELPPSEHTALARYVNGGGGLIVIFGDRNAKLSEESVTLLDKLLPVRAEPETPDKPTAVVLVVDKSQSMRGPKISMARAAARDSLLALRPTDRIGIVAFDDTFRWVAPIQSAGDTEQIIELINAIRADGSTRIYPPLKSAYDAIIQEKVASRHIILITDGVSPPGDMPHLLRDAAAHRVTISTVGIGSADVNQQMLENISSETRGRSYLVDDPDSLPQVVSGETKKLKETSIQELPVRARSVQPVEFTDGIDFDRAPRLLGFVKAKAKKGAETILRTDQGEPLLVRWQYGLGHVNAFMSDATNRWAANWVSWEGFGAFWPQMVRDVSTPDRRVHAEVRAGLREGEQIVAYDVLGAADGETSPDFAGGSSPRIVVGAPERRAQSLPLEETSPNHFEVRIPAGPHGLYSLSTGNAEFRLPVAGFFRESEELKPQTVNTGLLRQISAITGGRVNPTVDQLLDDTGTLTLERRPLWPYWLVLALALNFVELAIRKGHLRRWRARLAGVFARRPRTAPQS